MYLSDVTEMDGPFQYIKSSNNYNRSIFTRCIHTGIVYSEYPEQKLFDYENYEHRRMFMKLPKSMRGHLIIGSFINKDSEIYQILKAKHMIALGKTGSIFLFDGHNTLHTGGRAINRSRHTLFQAYFPFYKLFKRLNY